MAETNYEHYKDELIQSFLCDNQTTCRKMNILKNGCENCNTLHCSECEESLREWLNEKYKEKAIEIDWENLKAGHDVYVDTGLLEDNSTLPKYTFAKFLFYDDTSQKVYIYPIWYINIEERSGEVNGHRELLVLDRSVADANVLLHYRLGGNE